MSVTLPKLNWCIVRLGNDYNWWVKEISDSIHWDLDCLSILDPKQVAYILDLTEDLKEYGFLSDVLDRTFFRFKIDKRIGEDLVRLVRTEQSLLDSDEPLFALPDVIDEEKGPYVDFIETLTKLRVKLLNDSIDFEKSLSAEEITDELNEKYRQEYFEGTAIHAYRELIDILEYVPEGFELDKDEKSTLHSDEDYSDLAEDFDEEKDTLEEDETMQWDEEWDDRKNK